MGPVYYRACVYVLIAVCAKVSIVLVCNLAEIYLVVYLALQREKNLPDLSPQKQRIRSKTKVCLS